jgi:hypothetical protein
MTVVLCRFPGIGDPSPEGIPGAPKSLATRGQTHSASFLATPSSRDAKGKPIPQNQGCKGFLTPLSLWSKSKLWTYFYPTLGLHVPIRRKKTLAEWKPNRPNLMPLILEFESPLSSFWKLSKEKRKKKLKIFLVQYPCQEVTEGRRQSM